MAKEHLLLQLGYAPGDVVVFTAAIRDLALQYGDRFDISVKTHFSEVWKNNPHLVLPKSNCRLVHLRYADQLSKAYAGRQTHFLAAYHNILNEHLGTDVHLTLPRPDLHLDAEDRHPAVQKPYWVIFPGWKSDMPAKAWPAPRWQQLVDTLEQWGLHCVQTGAIRKGHFNPRIAGAEDATYPSNLRQLFHLISESEGVICGITSGMHIAAAFNKPCVVLAGGREPWWWEAYVNGNPGFGPQSLPVQVPHRFLHLQGQLDCCRNSGCNRRKVTQAQSQRVNDVCINILTRHGKPLPACMDPITPEVVLDAVLSYYLDGTLPPHSPQLQELTKVVHSFTPSIAGAPLVINRPDGLITEIRTLRPEAAPPEPEPGLPSEAELPVRPPASESPVFSSPNIGPRVTICLLTYGDHYDLHRTCLNALLTSTARSQVELRVGGNQLCPASRRYLRLLQDRGDIQHLNLSDENRYKYPVMRELFREPLLTTQWVVWLDDDTLCNIDDLWLEKLLAVADREFDSGCRWVGPHFLYRMTSAWTAWCQEAAWFKGVPWRIHNGRPKVDMAVGAIWAAHVPTLLAADVPDARLTHNKGDVTIGCQFWQAGAKLGNFSTRKDIVNWSSAARRGVTLPHPAEKGK